MCGSINIFLCANRFRYGCCGLIPWSKIQQQQKKQCLIVIYTRNPIECGIKSACAHFPNVCVDIDVDPHPLQWRTKINAAVADMPKTTTNFPKCFIFVLNSNSAISGNRIGLFIKRLSLVRWPAKHALTHTHTQTSHSSLKHAFYRRT